MEISVLCVCIFVCLCICVRVCVFWCCCLLWFFLFFVGDINGVSLKEMYALHWIAIFWSQVTKYPHVWPQLIAKRNYPHGLSLVILCTSLNFGVSCPHRFQRSWWQRARSANRENLDISTVLFGMYLLICTPPLTHWGRVTQWCVGKLSIICSDNGLSPGRQQAIIRTNAGILLIGPLGTNFSGIFIEIHTFSFKKMHLKMSPGKWRPTCLGLNVLMAFYPKKVWTWMSGYTP